jgi:signal peptidase II
MIRRMGVRLLVLFAVLGTVGCDQVTKHVARSLLAGAQARSYLADTIRLDYAENAGGFLSLGSTWSPMARTSLLTFGTGAMLLILAGAAVRSRLTGWSLLAAILFISGGASNWLDRATRGIVVDFMNLGIGPVRTGIFNAADVSILAGAAVFALVEIRRELARPPQE